MIAGFVKETQALEVTDYIYNILHAKSVAVDLEYYENPQYYDTLHRAQQEGPYRPTRIVNNLVQLGQSGISLLAMAGLLFSFHWGVAVVLFAAAVPGIIVRVKYSGKLFDWQRERTQTERSAGYVNWILTGKTHAKEIRLFDLGDLFIRRSSDLRTKLRQEELEISRKRSVADLGAQAGATLAVFGCFGFIAYRTVQSSITLLGKWFEDGEELSIGQWQKVALARAFLREFQIIVLDEPTSSLDVKTEYEVFTRFRKLREGRAGVLISHRFSTVRMADRIFVFEEGRIIERGSHEELVRYGGKYASLFEKQTRFYK